jgi:hypothetical protein
MPSKAQRTLFTLKRQKKFLAALADGVTVTTACQIAGWSRRYAYDLKNAYPEFNAAWDDAVEQGIDKLEDAIRQRALGQMEPIVYRGEVTGEVMRRSDLLAMFVLKAKRPEFRDNNKVEINVGDRLNELANALQGTGEDRDPDPEKPAE